MYIFGDPLLIRSESSEIVVRTHDSCCNSDVFGDDMCTCRPYLIFALQECIQCAQRKNGVGIVIYFRKEGCCFGEVIKFRIYNARINRKGGDDPIAYWNVKESICGVKEPDNNRGANCETGDTFNRQLFMPDVLNWLGITHIDWLLTMSPVKYDAVTRIGGITVDQRVGLPDVYIPKRATTEIIAKTMLNSFGSNKGGDRAQKPLKQQDIDGIVAELRDLRSIRKRCRKVYALAQKNQLQNFKLNMERMDECVDIVNRCILKYYPDYNIPGHSRFRHFEVDSLSTLMKGWTSKMVDTKEQCRRLIDLCTVSVLLDAGAGPQWKYIDHYNNKQYVHFIQSFSLKSYGIPPPNCTCTYSSIRYTRSEGLGIASFNMFIEGTFSSDSGVIPCRVNSAALKKLKVNELKEGFQVTACTNPMVGLEGRCRLLQRLGNALETYPQYFGAEVARPGHVLDFLLRSAQKVERDGTVKYEISIHVLWEAVIVGLASIWPENKKRQLIQSGDIWQYKQLKVDKVRDINQNAMRIDEVRI